MEFSNGDKIDYYYYFHHTNGDFMTVLKPDDINYVGAMYASVAYLIANSDF
jgi:hypothetical protein